MSTNTILLSRTLATVALCDPPDQAFPAILYREGTTEKSRPLRAISRSPYGALLQGYRDPETGAVYVWRKPGERAAVTDGVPPLAYRPLPPSDLAWCSPRHREPDPLTYARAHPGAVVLFREGCHLTLRNYYASKHPDLTFKYISGNLYAVSPGTPGPVPAGAPAYVCAGLPAEPRVEGHPRDRVPAGFVHAYLRTDVRVRTVRRAFPTHGPYADLLTDVAGTQHDRYLRLPADFQPTRDQARFLRDNVRLCVLQPGEPEPEFIRAMRRAQFSPVPVSTA